MPENKPEETDDSSVDALMHRADRALYQAESNGCDQVVGTRE